MTLTDWTKQSDNHYTAEGPGGEWSVERRVGIWMIFDPRVSKAVDFGLPSAEHGMAAAEKLASI